MLNSFKKRLFFIKSTENGETIEEIKEKMADKELVRENQRQLVFVFDNTTNTAAEAEERIIESLERSIRSLEESRELGSETMITVYEQGWKIDNINHKLDEIDDNIKESNRLLRGIKSFMSAFINKVTPSRKKRKKPVVSQSMPNLPQSQGVVPSSDEENETDVPKSRADECLDRMSDLLSDLHQMGLELNDELSVQNEKLDEINKKAEDENEDITKINRDIRNLL